MADYEYMTMYVKQYFIPGNGHGPTYAYSLRSTRESAMDQSHRVADIAEAFESYQRAGWTLIALVLIENGDTEKIYQATLKRTVS